MHWGMRGKIVSGFVGITLLLCAIAGGGLKKVIDDARDANTLINDSIQAAVRLSAAQNAMWQLRWNVGQFIAVQGDDRAKIVAGEPKTYKLLEDNIADYEKGKRTTEELASLKDL